MYVKIILFIDKLSKTFITTTLKTQVIFNIQLNKLFRFN